MTPSLLVLIVALGLAVLSMAAFAALHRGRRDADAARKGSSFLLGAGDFLVHWFMWAIGPAERALAALGTTPDHMNAGGLVFGLLSGVAIGRAASSSAAGRSRSPACATSSTAGSPRAQGVASPYGKFIDSTLDRFVETFAFLGFAVYFASRPWGPLVVAAGLGGSLLVSYAQARGETVDVSGSGGLMQRAERLVLTLLGCLFDPALCRALGQPEGTVLFWVLVVVAAGSLGTAVHRTVFIARRLRG